MRTIVILLFLGGQLAGAETAADREALARRVFADILSGGRFELGGQLYAADFVNHARTRDVGLAEDQAAARGWKAAAPDIQLSPELMVTEGDTVAVLWRGIGTNTGSGNGIPATGRRAEGRGITLWRIRDGRIREEWSEFTQELLLRQIGLAPGGSEPAAGSKARAYPPERAGVPSEERERNRRIATRVFEQIVGRGRPELFDSIYAKDFMNHGLFEDSGVVEEIEGTRALRELAPDLKVAVEKTVAQGDLVTVVYAVDGTHAGTPSGSAPTGQPLHLRGISIFRLRNGKITEEWSVLDR